jgi:uncharacterized membrane protein
MNTSPEGSSSSVFEGIWRKETDVTDDGGKQEIETFVRRLTDALQALPTEERTTIAHEIRCHLADSAARGEDALSRALRGMGMPESLGRSYMEEYRLAGALDQGSPVRLLGIVLGLTTRGLLGLSGGLGVIALYLIGALFFLVAGAKLVEPSNVGMWIAPNYFAFAILNTPPPVGAREILGYWIVPLSIVLGSGCLLSGTRLLRLVGKRLLKQWATRPESKP